MGAPSLSSTTGPRTKRSPLSIDMHVGERLKIRRLLAGKSQTDLAKNLDLTFQQIQKYEKGINRISAGHLLLFARALDCSPIDFYEGLQPEEDLKAHPITLSADEVRLFEVFSSLNESARGAVIDFVRSLAARRAHIAAGGQI